MITDEQARKIACDWHDGGGSALYALCSTGAIDTARSDHNAAAEVRECILWSAENGDDLYDLRGLLTYINLRSVRGERSPRTDGGACPGREVQRWT